MPTRSVPAPRAPMAEPAPVRLVDPAWLRVVERMFGGWAPTLRRSVALVTLFLMAAATVVFTLGAIGVLLVSCLGIVLTHRRITARVPRQ